MLPKVCRLLTFIFTIYFLQLLLHLDPLRLSQHGALSAVMCIFTAVLKKMCTRWISWMDLRMDSVDLVRKVSDLVKWLWSVCLNSLNTKRRLPGEVKAQSGSSGFCSRGRCCSVCVQHWRRCCRFFKCWTAVSESLYFHRFADSGSSVLQDAESDAEICLSFSIEVFLYRVRKLSCLYI